MTTELTERPVSELMQERPQIDLVNARRLTLLKEMSPNTNDADIGQMLEIAFRYDLDPFAREIYCARGQRQDGGVGKLLIMVSRDGLRKVARRNGLRLRGDVVREKDDFEISWKPDAEAPEIAHTYQGVTDEQRGPIVGAWAIVYDAETKEPMGFNVAPQSEYLPENENHRKKSAWGKTPSIMTLTAAERNALRQATPLSGLLTETDKIRVLAEGDEDRVDDPTSEAGKSAIDAFIAALDLETDLKVRIRNAVHEANEVAASSYPLSKVQLTFTGISGDQAEVEVAHIEEYTEGQRARKEKAEEEARAAEEIRDAEVVEEPDEKDAENRARIEHLTEEKAAVEADLEVARDNDASEEEIQNLEARITAIDAELDARQDTLPGMGG